jgi:hypothetical protein
VNDPTGKEQLLKLGVQTVPVLARSDQYIFCQNLEDVAEFVGLQGTGHTPLPPRALFTKWTIVLRAAQRYIRLLSHHIFRIGEAFLETAIDGVEYWVQLANVPPQDGIYTTGDEIASYGNSVIERIENWWTRLDDKSCQQKVKTFYGTPPMHQLFERSTWHSAQHTRQMIAVLERFGIEPDVRLTAEDLAGLPLPEGIWE